MPNVVVVGQVQQIQWAGREDFVNWVNQTLYEQAAAFGLKLTLEPIKPDELKVNRG